MPTRPHRSRTRLPAAAIGFVVLVAGLVTGCGSGDDPGDAPSTDLLTVKQVEEAGAGTPRAAVTRLFFFAQWGSAPNLIGSYSPGTVRALGPRNIAAGYAVLRRQLLATRPQITGELETSRGVLVNVELRREQGASQQESVLVRRRAGEWMVVYDSFLARGLELSVRLDSGQVDPNRAPPAAIREARSVLRRYYGLADAESRRDSDQPERGTESSSGSGG